MTASILIGGTPRILGHRPSGRRVGALKPAVDLAALPMRTPWLDKFPRDYDQGALNACGPNALAEIYEYKLAPSGRYSRLFSYYFTRSSEHDTADDGVTIDDLLTVAHTLGMPGEMLWEYDPAKYDTAPPTIAMDAAAAFRLKTFDAVADLDHLLFELTNRQPVLGGIALPASIEDGKGDTARTGIVPVPSDANPVIGHHAVNFVAYDRERQMVQCTSHWGADYGDHGTLWLSFAHWTSGNATDMRAVRKIGAV